LNSALSDTNINPNSRSKLTSNKNQINSKIYDKTENNINSISHSNNNYDPSFLAVNTNSVFKSPKSIGGIGFIDINSNTQEANNNKNNLKFNNTIANCNPNPSYEISETSKAAKSINAKIIVDPSKIYFTPTQKVYKTLNDNHVLFVKHKSKNK